MLRSQTIVRVTPAKLTRSPAGTATGTMNPLKPIVLIVDDHPLNIQMLAQVLGDEYLVKAATCGETALKVCRMAARPDLILLDVLMPEMDGYELCRLLKDDPTTKDIPVIFITAKNDVSDEELGFRVGAVDYIAKPFSPVVVQARVRTHLALKRNVDLLESLAFLDGLTGIPNRRRLDREMHSEWNRALRGQTPISLLMVDVDYFKKFNDNYGHGCGDDCLREVAGALEASVKRTGDLVARYGGEEFVILLPATDDAGLLRVARRIQENVKGLGIAHAHSQVADHITVSLGGYTLIPTPGMSDSILLDFADKLLYQAKQTGRNRLLYGSDAAPEMCGSVVYAP
jgi:diguanylate cyclase (GGDEF)-like protein